MRRMLMFGFVLVAAGCTRSANVNQEREAVLALDREWAQSTKDLDKFMSYFAPDATVYPQGMPVVRGGDAIRTTFGEMSSAPVGR
jgi:ketosteroid isomerase-like protein